MKNQWTRADIECLKKVYLLYEASLDTVDAVCRRKCSSCCTCNVTMTSLETAVLIASLTRPERKKLDARIRRHFPGKRYIPKMTPNMFARMCAQKEDLPDEENDPSWGACPLLVEDICSVYDVRPFGCRALMSQVNCRQKGYAQVPPQVVTLNHLFLQSIEMMDETGFFGNLSDMVTLFLTADDLAGGLGQAAKDDRFLVNEKISVLMVPTGHRQAVGPVLAQLSLLLESRKDKEGSHGKS